MASDTPALSFLSSISDPDKLPPAAMALNHSANAFLAGQAFWGPVTATLDWCEVIAPVCRSVPTTSVSVSTLIVPSSHARQANYQFSRYIAEAANTFSNLVTVGLAVYGAAQARSEKLPPRYLAGYAGFALVGIGSFIFHATLLFEAQLMDELPMIYVSSYCCAVLFDTTRGFSLKHSNAKELGIIFAMFNILFTWSYYMSRNPLYHQFVFAGLMFTTTFRTVYLLRNGEISKRLPPAERASIARLFSSGAATFALGFLVWNLDNIFCSRITRWKNAIGWPAAFLLEGHSWWHILTALGTYLMLIGNTYLTLCIKDDHSNFTVVKTAGIPRIKRVDKTKTH